MSEYTLIIKVRRVKPKQTTLKPTRQSQCSSGCFIKSQHSVAWARWGSQISSAT